ncbi:MAG: hypothetical protein COA58_01985 [Bacteroidetes bacterium]|nr:MAG: hypothetical protein COA58_01985 [Bacteroidota bacterium]
MIIPKDITEFYKLNTSWSKEIQFLESIIKKTELNGTFKWGSPVYTINNKNIVGIGSFKSYVGLWFHQGVFLKDPLNILINASPDKTRGLRQWRFKSIQEMDENLIKVYLDEAIENQKLGKKIKLNRDTSYTVPQELQSELNQEEFSNAFFNLSLGRQKEYANHIAEGKQEATRQRRVAKCIPLILTGKSLYDKYK